MKHFLFFCTIFMVSLPYMAYNQCSLFTSSGSQTVTITTGGVYEFQISGGDGGNAEWSLAANNKYPAFTYTSANLGGEGGTVRGKITLQAGDQVSVIVGEAGGTGIMDPSPTATGSGTSGGGGGGGSTGICVNGTLVMLAGGGGGQARGASTSTGNAGVSRSATTGTTGNGGTSSTTQASSGGGGGVNSAGANGFNAGVTGGGQGSCSGASGGTKGNFPGATPLRSGAGGSGYSGGGGSDSGRGGGGGGYTGGNGVADQVNGGFGGSNYTSGAVTDVSSTPAAAGGGGESSGSFSCLSAALPVVYEKIEGLATTSGNQLTWVTNEEIDHSHFEVEKATVDYVFKPVARVSKPVEKVGNNTLYNWLDPVTQTGTSYYRLKQTDIDGTFEYSPIVVIDNSVVSGFSAFSANGFIHVRTQWENYNLQVVSLSGTIVKQANSLSGNHSLDINDLPKGLYIVHGKLGEQVVQLKVTN